MGQGARLRFASGTIEIRGLEPETDRLPRGCRWDPRSACHRAPAADYAAVVLALREGGIAYEDEARRYDELEEGLRAHRDPRPYQREALDAWRRARGRGVVVLQIGRASCRERVLRLV